MVGVRKVFGLMLLGVSVWLLERVLPAPVTLALWGLLAVGTALWLGAPEFILKPGKQKLRPVAWCGLAGLRHQQLRALCKVKPTRCAHWVAWTPKACLKSAQPSAGRPSTPQQPRCGTVVSENCRPTLLLDWYADWCISCKVIEREVLKCPLCANSWLITGWCASI